MLKYDNYAITFAECPNEVSLYITITNCPIRCPNCNSKHLWNDEGKPLTWNSLNAIIHCNDGISAVCLGGGDNSPSEINKLAWHIKRSTNLKVCWYSGNEKIPDEIDLSNFDFIKLGRFMYYPINDKRTNQKYYAIERFTNSNGDEDFGLVNMTFLFWKDDTNNS